MHPVVLRAELRPAGAVGRRVTRKGRRNVTALELERVARHDPHERNAGRNQRGKSDHVVLDDYIRPSTRDDLGELVVAKFRSGDQLFPYRLDPGIELLDRRLAELRSRCSDELLPELPGIGIAPGGFGEVDQVFRKTERFELALP